MSDQKKYISKLSGARILVVGGTSGLGYSAAECMLEHDAGAIILSSSSADRVNEKIAQLQKAYPSKASRVSGHTCDLSSQNSLEKNLKDLLDKATNGGSQKLDHIVHTAGDKLKMMPLADVDMGTLMQAGMVRFFSAIMLCKLAPGYLNPGPASSVTLTTGAVSERPNKGWAVPVGYATGLHGVTRGMALELAPMRVNLISPGAVETELWDKVIGDKAKRQQMLEGVGKTMPTGQAGRSEDVAECYLYCVKDHNLTGSVVSTNGGALLVGPR